METFAKSAGKSAYLPNRVKCLATRLTTRDFSLVEPSAMSRGLWPALAVVGRPPLPVRRKCVPAPLHSLMLHSCSFTHPLHAIVLLHSTHPRTPLTHAPCSASQSPPHHHHHQRGAAGRVRLALPIRTFAPRSRRPRRRVPSPSPLLPSPSPRPPLSRDRRARGAQVPTAGATTPTATPLAGRKSNRCWCR